MDSGFVFSEALETQAEALERIRRSAHEAHADVNQHYGRGLPYAVHLDAVAERVACYGGEVCRQAADVLPLMFGAWFHDSIEDARLTYNDVRKRALALGLDEAQALLGAEIVYALTNDKGRTRAERAGEHYYAGIRSTPYAPLVKMADRAANIHFATHSADSENLRMREVYRRELPRFLAALRAESADVRLAVPAALADCARADLGMAE